MIGKQGKTWPTLCTSSAKDALFSASCCTGETWRASLNPPRTYKKTETLPRRCQLRCSHIDIEIDQRRPRIAFVVVLPLYMCSCFECLHSPRVPTLQNHPFRSTRASNVGATLSCLHPGFPILASRTWMRQIEALIDRGQSSRTHATGHAVKSPSRLRWQPHIIVRYARGPQPRRKTKWRRPRYTLKRLLGWAARNRLSLSLPLAFSSLTYSLSFSKKKKKEAIFIFEQSWTPYSLVQWNWFSVVTRCTWVTCISDVTGPISLHQAVQELCNGLRPYSIEKLWLSRISFFFFSGTDYRVDLRPKRVALSKLWSSSTENTKAYLLLSLLKTENKCAYLLSLLKTENKCAYLLSLLKTENKCAYLLSLLKTENKCAYLLC